MDDKKICVLKVDSFYWFGYIGSKDPSYQLQETKSTVQRISGVNSAYGILPSVAYVPVCEGSMIGVIDGSFTVMRNGFLFTKGVFYINDITISESYVDKIPNYINNVIDDVKRFNDDSRFDVQVDKKIHDYIKASVFAEQSKSP